MKTALRLFCVALIVLMAFAAVIPAAAESGTETVSEYIDVDRTGEVTFKITSSESKDDIIEGGSIALYKVATVDKYGEYTLLPDFATLEVDVNALEDTDESWGDAAEAIALYIKNHPALEETAQIIQINKSGQASVTGLTTGLYVALQDEAPKGYNPFKPFIIPMPYCDNDGQINYVLTAYPKGTSKIPAKECVVDIPCVKKTVVSNNGTAPKDTKFDFLFKALESGYPEIVNTSGSVEAGGDVVTQTADSITLRVVGEDTVEVGKITFTQPGVYYYEVSEINTKASGYKYDKTVYWCKYTITLNDAEDALIVSNILIKDGNANGKILYDGEGPVTLTFDFVNEYNEVPPPPDETTTETTSPSDNPPPKKDTPPKRTLPQTGQVWWPMIVLAAAGIVFIAAGIAVSKNSRKKRKDD